MAQFPIKNGLIQGTLAGTPTSGTLDISALTLTLPTVPVTQGGTGLTALGTAGQVIRVNAGGTALEYGTASGLGTVTSVGGSFTGGIISIAGSPITASGTLAFTVAGTSGGVPYFSSSSGWASSGELAANALVIGGGAGAAPSTTTTAAGALTFLGTPTFANLNSLVSDADLARTSGTNTFTGTQTFSGALRFTSGDVEVGANGTAGFFVIHNGATSTSLSVISSEASDTRANTIPDADGAFLLDTATQTLTNKTISGASNTITNVSLTSGVTGTLPVANGGTGATSLTANNVLLGNGTSALQAVAPGASGNVLTSNGTTWQSTAPSAGGDTYLVLASDTANSTTSFADVTGLTFAVTSGETYVFEAWIVYETAATTTGSKWAVNGPASPTLLSYSVETPTAATTSRIDFASTYDGTGPSTQTSGIGQCLAKIEGVVKVSASGTFALRFGSEVASSAVTAKAGSVMRYRKVQ